MSCLPHCPRSTDGNSRQAHANKDDQSHPIARGVTFRDWKKTWLVPVPCRSACWARSCLYHRVPVQEENTDSSNQGICNKTALSSPASRCACALGNFPLANPSGPLAAQVNASSPQNINTEPPPTRAPTSQNGDPHEAGWSPRRLSQPKYFRVWWV